MLIRSLCTLAGPCSNVLAAQKVTAAQHNTARWQHNTARWQDNSARWQHNSARWQHNSARWQHNSARWQHNSARWQHNTARWQHNTARWQHNTAMWQHNTARWQHNPQARPASARRYAAHYSAWHLKPLRPAISGSEISLLRWRPGQGPSGRLTLAGRPASHSASTAASEAARQSGFGGGLADTIMAGEETIGWLRFSQLGWLSGDLWQSCVRLGKKQLSHIMPRQHTKRSEVLRSLRHYLRAQSKKYLSHYTSSGEDTSRKMRPKIFLERTRMGELSEHRNCLKGNNEETSERRGGAHLSFPECVDATLTWTGLSIRQDMSGAQ